MNKIELDSEKILPKEERLIIEGDDTGLSGDEHLIYLYHKALEAAELKIAKLEQELNLFKRKSLLLEIINLEEKKELDSKYLEVIKHIDSVKEGEYVVHINKVKHAIKLAIYGK